MKQCVYCGKKFSDEVPVCEIDGQPLKEITETPLSAVPCSTGERQQIIDREHIKLLSVFHFVVSGLALLGILFVALHYLLMHSFLGNPELWKSKNGPAPPPPEVFKILIWLYVFFGLILTAACALNLLSGLFLIRRRYRVFSIVVGGLNCLQIPFGTILGIFTVMVLSRDSIRQAYAIEENNSKH